MAPRREAMATAGVLPLTQAEREDQPTMITPEQVAEMDAKYGRTVHLKSLETVTTTVDGVEVTCPIWECMFRKPTRQEWKHFKRQVHNPAEIADAQETLAMKCAILPGRVEFDKLLDEWPAIPEAATKAFDRLLGIVVESSGKGLPSYGGSTGARTRNLQTG